MQQRLLVLLALLAAPAVATTASSAAQAWLQSHKSPTDDQLGELKSGNPAAFAIVQALLSKHSKGEVKLTPEERGPDVFKAMMTPRHFSKAHAIDEPSADVPYASAELAEVRHPVVDQKNFNPDAAADRDESSVSRLLAAVAQMGGDKAKKIGLINAKRTHGGQGADTSNSLQADSSIFAEDDNKAPAVSVQAAEEEAAEAVQEPVQQAPPAPKKKKNSYLDGLDLTGDMPVATAARKHTVQQEDSLPDSLPTNLASFSFDEAAATPAPKKVAAPKKTNNVFLKWLSDSKKAPAPEAEQQAPAQPVQQEAAKASNPYANWMTL